MKKKEYDKIRQIICKARRSYNWKDSWIMEDLGRARLLLVKRCALWRGDLPHSMFSENYDRVFKKALVGPKGRLP